MEDPAEEPRVLDGQGRVEPERAPERRDLLGRRLGRQHESDGVARQVEEREDDERHRHDDAERLHQAPEEIRRHRSGASVERSRLAWPPPADPETRAGGVAAGEDRHPADQRTPAFQRKINSPIVGFQSTFLLMPKSAAGW